MAKTKKIIDRNSVDDAKQMVEKFLPNENARKKFIDFLCNAINYANSIKPDNWNLNLDKNGAFIRLNTGHEYCIELDKYNILVLCDRTTIKNIVDNAKIPIIYRGHYHHERIENTNINEVPDCLKKTPNSIGCVLKNENIEKYIDYFYESNRDFIKPAIIHTLMLPHMRDAHSNGAVEYIFSEFENKKENELIDIEEYLEKENIKTKEAETLTMQQLLVKIKQSTSKPTKTTVKQILYNRNENIKIFALKRANGICEKCGKSAPFIKDDGTPYLEVHHKIPLAEDENGDTVENVIALCPNCHKHAHYGKNTY
jgi:5-methylcytosine-specific restriction endonuclease McrA